MERLYQLPYQLLKKLVLDTCADKDGVFNSLRIMRNLCFGFGLYAAMQYPELESRWTFLILLGYGSQGMNILTQVYQRKTADSNGQPLMQEGSAVAPSEPVIPTVTPKADDQEIAEAV